MEGRKKGRKGYDSVEGDGRCWRNGADGGFDNLAHFWQKNFERHWLIENDLFHQKHNFDMSVLLLNQFLVACR